MPPMQEAAKALSEVFAHQRNVQVLEGLSEIGWVVLLKIIVMQHNL